MLPLCISMTLVYRWHLMYWSWRACCLAGIGVAAILVPYHPCQVTVACFNSLAPGRFKVNFRWVNFKLILLVYGWGMVREIALIWMSLDHTYGKSTLVQVMAWCRQATSHYLSQCWPRSQSPYGVTRPQWVKIGYSWIEYMGVLSPDELLGLSS